ncbi:hypothetical protein [Planctomicrobium piriforme]|uniref:MYXO-CTERM domain-containing protein n=1 Tax=Planctomicrobium piriforme TaxID=1576369 RepID=A0A1I3FU32_9PLAN|nr:hypothetical protein [Planctomicrobium piriforme]SFI14750.1 hypothetical protein SAMN05421753_10631 [Planctomicrobium piriforme]
MGRSHHIRTWGLGLALAWSLAGLTVSAQDTPPPAPAPQGPTKSLWVDGGITVAMIGLALFVVCRNSNRN